MESRNKAKDRWRWLRGEQLSGLKHLRKEGSRGPNRELTHHQAVISCYSYIADKLQGVGAAGSVLLEHQWMQKMQRIYTDFFQGAVVRQWAIAENITSLCQSRRFSKSWMGWISVFKFCNPACAPIYS